MWVEFVVGYLFCSERFFSGYSGFPLSSKTNISKFQFDLDILHFSHEPLARVIAQALPVLDVKFTFFYLPCDVNNGAVKLNKSSVLMLLFLVSRPSKKALCNDALWPNLIMERTGAQFPKLFLTGDFVLRTSCRLWPSR